MFFSLELIDLLSLGAGVDQQRLFRNVGNGEILQSSAHAVNHHLRYQTSPTNLDPFLWGSRFNLDQVTFVRNFSEVLISAARNSLPDKFPWFDAVTEKNIEITISALVSKWKNGTNGLKLEIGRMLASVFHPKVHADGSAVDYKDGADSYDQPMGRVLPNFYGRWDIKKAADNRQNCLGKFQLLVAIGELFNTDMLAVVPLDYNSAKLNFYRARACKLVCETIQRAKLPLTGKRFSKMLSVINQEALNARLPPLQHYSILYRADSKKWILVDPNAGLASISDDSIDYSKMYKTLMGYSNIAPSASYLLSNKQNEEVFQDFLNDVKLASSLILENLSAINQADNWASFVKVLSEIGVATKILNWDDFMDVPRNDIASAMVEIASRLYRLAYPNESISFTSLSQEDFSQLKETIIYNFLIRGEAEMLNHLRQSVSFAEAFHPLFEISLVPFRMATATISHVAYDIGQVVGRSTEEMLYSFGLAEGHLLNVALGMFSDDPSDHSKRALALLKLQSENGRLVQRFFKKGDADAFR